MAAGSLAFEIRRVESSPEIAGVREDVVLVQSLITIRCWWASGFEMTWIGALDGVVTYVIGIGLGKLVSYGGGGGSRTRVRKNLRQRAFMLFPVLKSRRPRLERTKMRRRPA
jgi:hypothetical protein